MKKFFTHLRNHIFQGLLAIIPLLLCYFALQLLYVLIDKKVMGFLGRFIHIGHIPGLGTLLLLFFLYLIGLIVSNIVGHQFFKLIERISKRIPFIKTIYGVGKQLSQGLSAADRGQQAFQKAVLVKLEGNGLWALAFVMSSVVHRETNEEYLFVLVPTSPTPTSGFVFVVKTSQTIDPGWSVEECLKAVVSIGIIPPPDIKFDSFSRKS